ncbi:MAG: YesL family protein [Lachnospiraceae bacterium]|nr:YesL family protein [Lachnospiraceae bacterium]
MGRGAGHFFFGFLNKMSDVIILSIVFTLTCIPLITIGTAGTALYYTVQKVLRRDHGYLLKEYFRSFKENFKQTCPIWLVFLAIIIVNALGMFILNEYRLLGFSFGNFFVLPGAVIILVMSYAIQIFTYIARFEGTTREVLKTAGTIGILNLGKAAASTILVFAGIVVVLYVLPLFIFIPALVCLGINFMMESVYRKYMSAEDLEKEEERDHEEDEAV